MSSSSSEAQPLPENDTKIIIDDDGMITERMPLSRRVRRWLSKHRTMIRNGVVAFIGFMILVAYFYCAWAVLMVTFAAMTWPMWCFFGISVIAAMYGCYLLFNYMNNIKLRFAHITD